MPESGAATGHPVHSVNSLALCLPAGFDCPTGPLLSISPSLSFVLSSNSCQDPIALRTAMVDCGGDWGLQSLLTGVLVTCLGQPIPDCSLLGGNEGGMTPNQKSR